MDDYVKPSLEEAIEHFGIRGMHWGSRKSSPQTSPTHLPTQEQLLSEHRTPAKINSSTQKNDSSKDEIKKDITQLLARSALLMGAGILISNGPQMKVAYTTIKNSARVLRGQRAVARQGRSLLQGIGTLPVKSLIPVRASARMIGRSLQNARN